MRILRNVSMVPTYTKTLETYEKHYDISQTTALPARVWLIEIKIFVYQVSSKVNVSTF